MIRPLARRLGMILWAEHPDVTGRIDCIDRRVWLENQSHQYPDTHERGSEKYFIGVGVEPVRDVDNVAAACGVLEEKYNGGSISVWRREDAR